MKEEIKVIANTVPPTRVGTIHFLSPLKLVFTTSHKVVNIIRMLLQMYIIYSANAYTITC